MIRRKLLLFVSTVLGLGLLAACAMVSPEASFAPRHPQALESGRPQCSECHGTDRMKGGFKSYEALNHTPDFVKNHKFQARQDSAACASCHAQSFCADCHAGKVPMSPTTRYGDRPDREMPHRGNYLILHRIDGRMDPTGCYKCHGRANNDKCAACHR